jgi:hypothetical protein
MILYHGGTDIVETPRIIYSAKGRDFGTGFYTTDIELQAIKWAKRLAKFRKKDSAILNIYEFDADNAYNFLNIKSFDGYSMEWLDLIVACRQDGYFKHEFDIVTGKIADDDVGETVQTVVDGLAPKEFALSKLTYMSANNQICFCTESALSFIKFIKAERLV